MPVLCLFCWATCRIATPLLSRSRFASVRSPLRSNRAHSLDDGPSSPGSDEPAQSFGTNHTGCLDPVMLFEGFTFFYRAEGRFEEALTGPTQVRMLARPLKLTSTSSPAASSIRSSRLHDPGRVTFLFSSKRFTQLSREKIICSTELCVRKRVVSWLGGTPRRIMKHPEFTSS
ncbi:hypothetical protein LIA77_02328 [Sarocladium implicatum]|nr:hypothetical protein LIA77_02328 [Sarocladium implicatum]